MKKCFRLKSCWCIRILTTNEAFLRHETMMFARIVCKNQKAEIFFHIKFEHKFYQGGEEHRRPKGSQFGQW